MTYEEAKEVIRVAIAEVEWNYPLEYAAAFRMAKEALGKQLPKKPICLDRTKHFENCDIILCPRCKKRLKMKSKGAYCDKCGGALDWSDDNGET